MQVEGAQGDDGGSSNWENKFKKLQDLWLTPKPSSKRSGSEGLSLAEALAKIRQLEADLKESQLGEALAKQELENTLKKHEEEISYNEKFLGGLNWQAKIERLEADLKEVKAGEAQAQRQLEEATRRHDEKILFKDKQLRMVTGNLTDRQAKINSLEADLDKAKRREMKMQKELKLVKEEHIAELLERDKQLENFQANTEQPSGIDEQSVATKKIMEENLEVLTDEFKHCMQQVAEKLGQFDEQLKSVKEGEILTAITEPPPMFRDPGCAKEDEQVSAIEPLMHMVH